MRSPIRLLVLFSLVVFTYGLTNEERIALERLRANINALKVYPFYWFGNADRACSAWSGVTCAFSGAITAIEISGYNMTGSIPSEIGGLTSARVLDFSSNLLSGTLPSSLSRLTSLKSINFANNRLFGCPPFIESTAPHFTQNYANNMFYCDCANIGTTTCVRTPFALPALASADAAPLPAQPRLLESTGQITASSTTITLIGEDLGSPEMKPFYGVSLSQNFCALDFFNSTTLHCTVRPMLYTDIPLKGSLQLSSDIDLHRPVLLGYLGPPTVTHFTEAISVATSLLTIQGKNLGSFAGEMSVNLTNGGQCKPLTVLEAGRTLLCKLSEVLRPGKVNVAISTLGGASEHESPSGTVVGVVYSPFITPSTEMYYYGNRVLPISGGWFGSAIDRVNVTLSSGACTPARLVGGKLLLCNVTRLPNVEGVLTASVTVGGAQSLDTYVAYVVGVTPPGTPPPQFGPHAFPPLHPHTDAPIDVVTPDQSTPGPVGHPSSLVPSTTMLVIVSILAVLVAFAAILGVYFLCRNRQRAKRKHNSRRPFLRRKGTFIELVDSKGITVIKPEDVEIRGSIGNGASGIVTRATWIPKKMDIAIKQIVLPSAKKQSVRLLDVFLQEIHMMHQLAHPNILQLVGVIIPNEHEVKLVTEFMENGTLADVLPSLRSARVLPLIQQIAFAMHYLHCRQDPILHRDLKLENIFVGKNWTIKVSDFGLSKYQGNTITAEGICGTPFYMAPEIIKEGLFSEKSDVWAFGVVCFELYTRERPFSGIKPMHIMLKVAREGMSVASNIPDDCPGPLAALIRQCVAQNPKERPDFKEIIDSIKSMSSLVL